jgi:hypothetical protein
VADEPIAPFPDDVLELLRDEAEVDIETWSEPRGSRRTTIWVVVADGAPYIRSVRGEDGRWYRDLRLEPHCAIYVNGRRIEARAIPADDRASVEACSRELARKYAGDPGVSVMLVPHVLPTTMRLEPA